MRPTETGSIERTVSISLFLPLTVNPGPMEPDACMPGVQTGQPCAVIWLTDAVQGLMLRRRRRAAHSQNGPNPRGSGQHRLICLARIDCMRADRLFFFWGGWGGVVVYGSSYHRSQTVTPSLLIQSPPISIPITTGRRCRQRGRALRGPSRGWGPARRRWRRRCSCLCVLSGLIEKV